MESKSEKCKTEERQPDEVLRTKAREFGPEWVKRRPEQPKSWLNGSWSDEAMAEFAAAFAQSIQAEARQEIAKAHALAAQSHSQWLLMMDEKATFSAEEIVNRFKHWWDATERAEKAEQQLAEARAQVEEIVEQAKKAILAAGHRATPRCTLLDVRECCNCGAVETFKIESGEFWRLVQAQKQGK